MKQNIEKLIAALLVFSITFGSPLMSFAQTNAAPTSGAPSAKNHVCAVASGSERALAASDDVSGSDDFHFSAPGGELDGEPNHRTKRRQREVDEEASTTA